MAGTMDTEPAADKRPPLSQTERITSLAMRMDALESTIRNKTPSPRERFMARAGVVALCISICTGGFTLYDRLVVRPNADALEAFKSSVKGIAEINQDVQARAAKASSPAESASIIASRNLEKWRLLRDAEEHLPTVTAKATAQDYYILSLEETNTNRFDRAVDFIKRAEMLSRRVNDNTELSEILRVEAQIISMAQGADGLDQARKIFAEAQQVLVTENTFGSSFLRARVAGERAILEAFWGDCLRVGELLVNYATERDRRDVLPANRAALQQTLTLQLGNQNRCPVNIPALPAP